MARTVRDRLRTFLSRRLTLTVSNSLVIASVALLFVLRLVPMAGRAAAILETADFVVLAIFALEFGLRLYAFGRGYFLRDFGWVDLLSVVPIFAPLLASMGQLRSLRIARLVRLVRIIRVVRLVRSLDEGDGEHLQMRARFFLAVSSTAMLFLLATAVVITALVDRTMTMHRLGDSTRLLDQIELVIMSAAVLAAVGITATANHFLRTLVTDRIDAVNDYLDSVYRGGNKLPMRRDELGDEISDLQDRVSRVSNAFLL